MGSAVAARCSGERLALRLCNERPDHGQSASAWRYRAARASPETEALTPHLSEETQKPLYYTYITYTTCCLLTLPGLE